MSAPRTYQWRLATGGIMVGAVLCIALALLPFITTTLEQHRALRAQQERIAFMKDWKGQLETLAGQQALLTEQVGSAESGLLPESEFPQVIEYLFATAKRGGVKIERLVPRQGSALTTPLTQRTVELECSGRYHDIAALINRVEQSSFITRVRRIELSKEEGEVSATMELVFTMQTQEGR